MFSIRYLCLRIVLDIAQIDSSQDSRTIKLQKEEFSICLVRPIKMHFLQILNKTRKLVKHLRFKSNTAKYKSETLIHVFQDLWVVLMRSKRFCTLLNQQSSTGD